MRVTAPAASRDRAVPAAPAAPRAPDKQNEKGSRIHKLRGCGPLFAVQFLFFDRIDTRNIDTGAIRSFDVSGIKYGNLVSDLQTVRKVREIRIGADGEGDGTIVCLEDKGVHRLSLIHI